MYTHTHTPTRPHTQVLVLNLKRFMQTARGRMRKVDQFVRFPRTLDVSPFCHQESGEGADARVYELYGLVEHHGSLSGGHYVAYVAAEDSDGEEGGETRSGRQWYYFSDTQVKRVDEAKVLSREAYILFYRRVTKGAG